MTIAIASLGIAVAALSGSAVTSHALELAAMCDAIPMRASIALPCNGASLITTAYATRRVHRADPRGRTFRIADTAGESDFDIPTVETRSLLTRLCAEGVIRPAPEA